MKISLYVCFSDIISAKETLIDKLNALIIRDEKRQMYKTHSLDYILSSLKKAGVDGLELLVPKTLTDKSIQEVKSIIKKHALSIFAVHQSNNNIYNISLSEIERLCDIANKFSANIVTLHSDALGKNLFDNKFIFELKKLQEKYNVTFGIENMPKSPFSLFKTYTYNTNEFSSVLNNAGLFITFDTTHLAQAKGNICDFYKNNKERVVNIHISDYQKSWLNRVLLLANQTHFPLGQGGLPMEKFLKTLKRENYQGLITMEINANLEALCQNAQMIKNALK